MLEMLTITLITLVGGASFGALTGLTASLYLNLSLWARAVLLVVFIMAAFIGLGWLFDYFHVGESRRLMFMLWAVWVAPFVHARVEEY